MLGLSALYIEAGLDEDLDEIFYGLKAAVGALVAMAVVRLSRKFIDDVPLAVLAVASFALTYFAGAGFLVVLAGAGMLYWLWAASGLGSRGLGAFDVASWGIVGVLAGAVTVSLTAEIFLEGLKAGLLTFGGAYTVIPFLQESAVESKEWLTDGQFLDGLAMAGALPAPAIIFSTFVGYLAGGLAGGIAITVGIFLPAFVLPIFFHHQLVAVAESPRTRPFLIGVAAGVIGLIAAVTVDILEEGVVDLPTALLATGAFAALYRWQGKLTVLWVVGGCGLIGGLLQATGAV
jgi:chromate transporter